MKSLYKTVVIFLFLLLIITIVSAEGNSTILDNDQTSQISGDALVLISVGIFVFAAIIIIKILSINRGG